MSEPAQEQASGPQRAVDLSKPHLLYVEDDPVTAKVVRRVLNRAGFEVDWAQDGDQGISKLDYHDYDAVLLDYQMPKKNGIEVIRTMTERGHTSPVIMLTGSGDEVIAVEAMKLGAIDYVVKDVDCGYLTLLPAVIEGAIKRYRLAQQKRDWEEEREQLILELQRALEEVKRLGGLLPVCASCKKIRDDAGYWRQVDEYLATNTDTEVSHAICPSCAEKLYGDILP